MSDRIRKINEFIREEAGKAIASLIDREVFLTVTAVETSDNLKHSTVWVSAMGDKEAALEYLNEKRSEIQHMITSKMATKYTPKIVFKIDLSQDYVAKIEELLNDK